METISKSQARTLAQRSLSMLSDALSAVDEDLDSKIETVKVNGTALTPSNKAVNIDLSGYAKSSDLSGYVATETGKTLSSNDFTTTEKNKLSGIAANAQVNVIETVKVNGTALTPTSKAVNIDISGKVDKVTGKGLSTNDYTTTEKNKLSGIAEGAQVNVIETVKVNGTALTPTSKAVNIDISGKVDKVTGKGLSTNDYTTTEKNKLSGIAANAQVNVIETVKVNGTDLTPTSKAVDIDISGKIDKVTTPTAGNVPILNSDGTLANSTVAAANIMQKATSATAGNIAIFNAEGAVVDAQVNYAKLKDLIPVRYGYKIKKSESSPSNRVEYLYDAVGFTPAAMNFSTGVFNYGSWADVWFIKDNKPLMLKSDGTVDYYLDPDDYTKKEDGTASDVSNTNYDGNAMAQMPLVWFYRYEDDEYIYEIVSNVQWDENYKAYAHIDANGNLKPYFYWGLFDGTGDSTKFRSLKASYPAYNITAADELAGATANGAGWNMKTLSQFNYIRTLCILLGKSTNSQAVFGLGNAGYGDSVNYATDYKAPGSLSDKGQFWGSNSQKNAMKMFHVENVWGSTRNRYIGLLNYNNILYVKMTPEGSGYSLDNLTGYTDTGINAPVLSASYNIAYITQIKVNEYGFFVTDTNSSFFANGSNQYYCDWAYGRSISGINCCLTQASGLNNDSTTGGIFSWICTCTPESTNGYYGATISYV